MVEAIWEIIAQANAIPSEKSSRQAKMILVDFEPYLNSKDVDDWDQMGCGCAHDIWVIAGAAFMPAARVSRASPWKS